MSGMSLDELKMLFNIIDSQNKGYITIEELTSFFERFGADKNGIDRRHVPYLFRALDINSDGKVVFAEVEKAYYLFNQTSFGVTDKPQVKPTINMFSANKQPNPWEAYLNTLPGGYSNVSGFTWNTNLSSPTQQYGQQQAYGQPQVAAYGQPQIYGQQPNLAAGLGAAGQQQQYAQYGNPQPNATTVTSTQYGTYAQYGGQTQPSTAQYGQPGAYPAQRY